MRILPQTTSWCLVVVCRGGKRQHSRFEFRPETQKRHFSQRRIVCKRCGGWSTGGKVTTYVNHILRAPLLSFCRPLSCIRPDDFTIDQGCERKVMVLGQPPSAVRVFLCPCAATCVYVPRAPSITACAGLMKLGKLMMRWQGTSWTTSSW